ncbi:MAG: sugar ABC transporter permease [Oscillospiraceae bacterium]|nr:sugar ABC transporter permease [Oscillospiraceae bacterium]
MIAQKSHKGLSYRKKKELKGWIFVSLFLLGFLVYYLPVLIDAVRYSFSDLDVTGKQLLVTFVGGEHYHYAFMVHPDFLKTLVTSIGQLGGEIGAILIFSLFLATVLNQKMPGRAFFRMIFFIPVVMATGVVEKYEVSNILMEQMENTAEMGSTAASGALFDAEAFLATMGIIDPNIVEMLSSLSEGIYGIVQKSGVQLIIFLAGLQSISPSIYEVAKIEGASGWEIFWKITFPMLMPMIFVNTMYTIIDSFTRSSNAVVELITEIGFQNSNLEASTAMSLVYSLVVLAVLGIVAGVFTMINRRQGVER